MPTILIRRRGKPATQRAARFGIDARRVAAIVIPPVPPRPSFFRPQVPSGLSANNVAMRLGLVRKIDRQTGKMHFEKRQIKALRSEFIAAKIASKYNKTYT